MTHEEASHEMEAYAKAHGELERMEEALERKIQALREREQKRVALLHHIKGRCSERLHLYALHNPHLFSPADGRVSLGAFGAMVLQRKGRRIKKKYGHTWADVIQEIKAKGLPFLKVREEIDKEKILSAAQGETSDIGLSGIEVADTECFCIEVSSSPPEEIKEK